MSDPNSSNDQKIFATLKKHGVPFVVVGGHAVIRHGYMRSTEDVDVVWLRTPGSSKALLAALTELNAVWIGKEVDPATRLERTYPVTAAYVNAEHLMMLWTNCGPLDIFDYIPGMPLEPVVQLFDSAAIDDGLAFVSLDWLRKMKLAAARPKDKNDLEELSKIEAEQKSLKRD
jgi:hypothetical protein